MVRVETTMGRQYNRHPSRIICVRRLRHFSSTRRFFPAATTFDITRLIGVVNRMTERITVVSLLQPPPETVALFDDVILVSEGMVIYCGPVDRVEEYFNSLGYGIPERMDLADWLQVCTSTLRKVELAIHPQTAHVFT